MYANAKRETLAPARTHSHRRNSKTDSSSLPRSPLDRTRTLHCRTHRTNPYTFASPAESYPHESRTTISQAIRLYTNTVVVVAAVVCFCSHRNELTRIGAHTHARARVQRQSTHRGGVVLVLVVQAKRSTPHRIADSHSRRVWDMSFHFILWRIVQNGLIIQFFLLYRDFSSFFCQLLASDRNLNRRISNFSIECTSSHRGKSWVRTPFDARRW